MAGPNGVVIIGAGMGGLSAAVLLAARGLPVTVVERMGAPGGKLRTVDVAGVAVDAGPTVFTYREVFEQLRERGIGVNIHYIPVHTQPYYRALGFAEGQFPEAERYYAEAISLPMFPTITAPELDAVVNAVREVVTG